MKLVKILVKDDELLKSFDELVITILTINNDAIEYSKKMYCYICKKFFIIDKDEIKNLTPEEKKEIWFKRKCDTCNERFEFIIKNSQIKLIVICFRLLMFYYIDTTTKIRRIVKNTGLLENSYKTVQYSSDNTLRDFLVDELKNEYLTRESAVLLKEKKRSL